MPPPVPFPLEVLPYPARRFVEAVAKSISCPPDFAAAACLAVASGAIGRSVLLRVKDGFIVPASLYIAAVGLSSDGKSPSIDAALAPIGRIADGLAREHAQAMADWRDTPEADRGPEPVMRRIDTSNPTPEALARILAANPRGLLFHSDEFTSRLMSMGQYKAGKNSDRQFYLQSWGGSKITQDRARDAGNPIIVRGPFLSIIGGITPGNVAEMARDGGDEDGFMARILIVFPRPMKRRLYNREGVPDDIAADWAALVEALWARPMREHEGVAMPHVVGLTEAAGDVWANWSQENLDEQGADDFPDHLRPVWGKMHAYCARLALVLHLLDLTADPTAAPGDDPPPLPRRTIEDAIKLVTYFKAQARRAAAAMRGGADEGGPDVRGILKWLRSHERPAFSVREINNNTDRFKAEPKRLAAALKWMTDRQMIRAVEQPRKAGRTPTPKFEVNPSLRDHLQNLQNLQNAELAGSFEGFEGSEGMSRDAA